MAKLGPPEQSSCGRPTLVFKKAPNARHGLERPAAPLAPPCSHAATPPRPAHCAGHAPSPRLKPWGAAQGPTARHSTHTHTSTAVDHHHHTMRLSAAHHKAHLRRPVRQPQRELPVFELPNRQRDSCGVGAKALRRRPRARGRPVACHDQQVVPVVVGQGAGDAVVALSRARRAEGAMQVQKIARLVNGRNTQHARKQGW